MDFLFFCVSSNMPSVTMCYFYNLFFFHLFLYEHEEIKRSQRFLGALSISTQPLKRKCSGTNVLIKIHKVVKGKVNCKRLFCFNYVQVSGNRELFIKGFEELMIMAVVQQEAAGNPGTQVSPRATSPASRPAARLSVCCQSCQRSTTQPHGRSRGESNSSLKFASDPACHGLRRKVFTSRPNELELQKTHSLRPELCIS